MTAEHMRALRARGASKADKVQTRTRAAAIKWVRTEHPEVWERLLNEAWATEGVPRPTPGRPSTRPADWTPPPKKQKGPKQPWRHDERELGRW